MRTPEAEVEIDEALVDALLRDQFPELVADVRIVASGWDNVIARVGPELCVRMPRRELSAPLVRHEADWLPRLAPTLPAAVPSAIAIGAPGRGYPWTWLVCPWFPGRRLADVEVADRVAAAEQLGAFVIALHRPAPDDAPLNPWRGVPLTAVDVVVARRLAELPAEVTGRLRPVWHRSLDVAPYDGPPTWLHGDLHPLNVLAHPTEPTLRAVLDWGDLGVEIRPSTWPSAGSASTPAAGPPSGPRRPRDTRRTTRSGTGPSAGPSRSAASSCWTPFPAPRRTPSVITCWTSCLRYEPPPV